MKPVKIDLLKHLYRTAGISNKAGSVPESMIYVGKERKVPAVISSWRYDKDSLENFSGQQVEMQAGEKNYWLNIDGISDTRLMKKVGDGFGIHPLVLEDILNTNHIPKFEEDGKHLFITMKMLLPTEDDVHFGIEQISFVLGKEYLLSFQEKQGDVFDPVKERLRNPESKVRQRSSDYLLYSLIDIIVDNYYLIMERIGREADALEDSVFFDPGEHSLQEIQELKKNLLLLHKSVLPLREALMRLIRSESPLLEKDHIKYFNDILDHVQHVLESIDTYREIIPGMRDVYLSALGQQTNKVMQVLTIIATIFIPLTFIVGIYGMNFDNIPELHAKNGYYYVMGFMGLIALLLLWFFQRRKWL